MAVSHAAFGLFALCLLWFPVDGLVKVEFKFLSYDIPRGIRFNGEDCESWFKAANFRECDPMFHLCFDKPDGTNSVNSCEYKQLNTGHWDDRDHLHFGSNMKGIANPVLFDITNYQGGVRFKAKTIDDDVKDTEVIDRFNELIEVTPAETRDLSERLELTLYGQGKTYFKVQVLVYYDHESELSPNGDFTADSKVCTEIILTSSNPRKSFKPEKDIDNSKDTDECWLIKSESNEKPRVQISAEHLDLEEGLYGSDSDKVAVYDGHSIDACKFGDYCKSCPPQVSSSNYIYVQCTTADVPEDARFTFTVEITSSEASVCLKASGGYKSGTVFGTLVVLFILILCICCYCYCFR